MAAMVVVVLGGLMLPMRPAAASTCTINVGGKWAAYVCEYGVTRFDYQGRDHRFIIGSDNHDVWHIWENDNGTYSDWTSLGGTARSGVRYNISGANNEVLMIKVRGTFNGCWNRFYNYPGNLGRWTDWFDQPDPPGDSFCGT
jgi:hypothetical protein